MKKNQKIRNLIWSFTHRIWWDFKEWFQKEWFQKNCPLHISRKLPTTDKKCSCGLPLKIYAYYTGDGYVFEWECDNGCAEHMGEFEEEYPGWWPFLFGAWGNREQFLKIGIEEL